MRALGMRVAVAVLLGLVAWRWIATDVAPAPEHTGSPASPVALPQPLPVQRAVSPAQLPVEAASPEPQPLEVEHVVAKARSALGKTAVRASARGDFALAPGRILKSLLLRRCGLVQDHAHELVAERARLGLRAADAEGLCRELLFLALKERLSLPADVSEDRFWDMLDRVDAAYERLVVEEPSSEKDSEFRAASERFRETRRGIVGPDLDRQLFGLADEVLDLPFRVDDLARDTRLSLEQKLAAYEETLRRIEREHGVQLASVVEPLELAKHALRLHETGGPLSPDQQQAVLERYVDRDTAWRYLTHHQEQQDRDERLRAFNQEREKILEQLARAGLDAEQRRQRMAEIDQQLFQKYQLQ